MHTPPLQVLRDVRRSFDHLPSSYADVFGEAIKRKFADYYRAERAAQSLPPLPEETSRV